MRSLSIADVVPVLKINAVGTVLHPSTTVEVGDIGKAKVIANMLKDDMNFYDECSKQTMENYEKYYAEDKFVEHTLKIMNRL